MFMLSNVELSRNKNENIVSVKSVRSRRQSECYSFRRVTIKPNGYVTFDRLEAEKARLLL